MPLLESLSIRPTEAENFSTLVETNNGRYVVSFQEAIPYFEQDESKIWGRLFVDKIESNHAIEEIEGLHMPIAGTNRDKISLDTILGFVNKKLFLEKEAIVPMDILRKLVTPVYHHYQKMLEQVHVFYQAGTKVGGL